MEWLLDWVEDHPIIWALLTSVIFPAIAGGIIGFLIATLILSP